MEKDAGKGRALINSLPPDALRQVFSFIDDVAELERLKLVCKRWWSCVPCTPAHLTLTSSVQVSPVLVRRYPCLQSVVFPIFREAEQKEDGAMWLFGTSTGDVLSSLTSLDMRALRPTPSAFDPLLTRLTTLRVLKLPSGPVNHQVLSSLSSLRHLSVRYFNQAVDAGAIAALTGLRGLEIIAPSMSPKHLLTLVHLTNLRWLVIGRCGGLTDEVFCTLVTTLQGLEGLRLPGSPVTDLKGIGSLRRLEFLDISSLNVLDTGIKRLRSLTTLVVLSLRFCDRVTLDGIRQLGSLPRLRHLDITKTNISIAEVDKIFAGRKLDFSPIASVTK